MSTDNAVALPPGAQRCAPQAGQLLAARARRASAS